MRSGHPDGTCGIPVPEFAAHLTSSRLRMTESSFYADDTEVKFMDKIMRSIDMRRAISLSVGFGRMHNEI